MNKSKTVLVAKSLLGTILIIVGAAPGLPFLLVAVLAATLLAEDGSLLVMITFLFLTLACAIPVVIGVRIKRKIKRYRNYVHLISQEERISLRKLAHETGQTVPFLERDLQSMIRMKYFQDAYIDEARSEIVVRHPFDGIDITGLDMETVICPSCGANLVKRRNTSAQCEYCGSAVA